MINLIDIKNKTINLDPLLPVIPSGIEVKIVKNGNDEFSIAFSALLIDTKLDCIEALSWDLLSHLKDPESMFLYVFFGLKREIERRIVLNHIGREKWW